MKSYTFGDVKFQAAKFNDPALAKKFALSCIVPHFVMLGDDGKYWVVKSADAEKLYNLGFEFAE